MQRVHSAVAGSQLSEIGMAGVADATPGAIALAVSSMTMLRGGGAAPPSYG